MTSAIRTYASRHPDPATRGPARDDDLLLQRTAARGRHVDWTDDFRHYVHSSAGKLADEHTSPLAWAEHAAEARAFRSQQAEWHARARDVLREPVQTAEGEAGDEWHEGSPTRAQLVSLISRLQEQVSLARNRQAELSDALHASREVAHWQAVQSAVAAERMRREETHEAAPTPAELRRMFLGRGERAPSWLAEYPTGVRTISSRFHGGPATSLSPRECGPVNARISSAEAEAAELVAEAANEAAAQAAVEAAATTACQGEQTTPLSKPPDPYPASPRTVLAQRRLPHQHHPVPSSFPSDAYQQTGPHGVEPVGLPPSAAQCAADVRMGGAPPVTSTSGIEISMLDEIARLRAQV